MKVHIFPFARDSENSSLRGRTHEHGPIGRSISAIYIKCKKANAPKSLKNMGATPRASTGKYTTIEHKSQGHQAKTISNLTMKLKIFYIHCDPTISGKLSTLCTCSSPLCTVTTSELRAIRTSRRVIEAAMFLAPENQSNGTKKCRT